jgi:ZIP family zinc transporter
MFEAAVWGLLAASSLLLGAAIALAFRPGKRVVGLAMAFGAGTLISAVSYDLIGKSIDEDGAFTIAIAMLIGAAVYVAGDWLIATVGGHESAGHIAASSAAGATGLAIVLGTVLDGVPESVVLGLSFVEGGSVSVSLLAAVFVSNLPEGLGATSDLRASGWSAQRIMMLWASIAVVSAVAAGVGYAWFDSRDASTGAHAEAFAAGAILAMLADTMIPEAFREGGRFAGIVTVLGFVTGVALTGAN